MAEASKKEIAALKKEKEASTKKAAHKILNVPIGKDQTIHIQVAKPKAVTQAQLKEIEGFLAKWSSSTEKDLKDAFKKLSSNDVRVRITQILLQVKAVLKEEGDLAPKENRLFNYFTNWVEHNLKGKFNKESTAFVPYRKGKRAALLKKEKEAQKKRIEKQKAEEKKKKHEERKKKVQKDKEKELKARDKQYQKDKKHRRHSDLASLVDFDDDISAYQGGLDDGYYYDRFDDGYNDDFDGYYDYDGGYKTSGRYIDGYQRSGKYEREGDRASFVDFDDYYYDEDSEVESGGLNNGYYYNIFADEYEDDMNGYYDYDGGYEASAKLSAYDGDNYYGGGARLGRYYGSNLKIKQGRNHGNRYGRRGLMDYMEHEGVSGDAAALILSVILFIGLICLFLMAYNRHKMRKTGLDEKYRKMEKQIIIDGDCEDEDQV